MSSPERHVTTSGSTASVSIPAGAPRATTRRCAGRRVDDRHLRGRARAGPDRDDPGAAPVDAVVPSLRDVGDRAVEARPRTRRAKPSSLRHSAIASDAGDHANDRWPGPHAGSAWSCGSTSSGRASGAVGVAELEHVHVPPTRLVGDVGEHAGVGREAGLTHRHVRASGHDAGHRPRDGPRARCATRSTTSRRGPTRATRPSARRRRSQGPRRNRHATSAAARRGRRPRSRRRRARRRARTRRGSDRRDRPPGAAARPSRATTAAGPPATGATTSEPSRVATATWPASDPAPHPAAVRADAAEGQIAGHGDGRPRAVGGRDPELGGAVGRLEPAQPGTVGRRTGARRPPECAPPRAPKPLRPSGANLAAPARQASPERAGCRLPCFMATSPRSPESLRVAWLIYRGNPHCGGQGVYTRYIAREAIELGHHVEVLSGPPYPELDDPAGPGEDPRDGPLPLRQPVPGAVAVGVP